MGDKKRVTIAELAQELGYSKSTISRALSGKGRLSSETRENILRYCEMSGYQSKATLDKKWMTRNYNITVVMPSEQEILEIPFFYNCIMGICNAAQEKGYHIILLSLRVGELQPLKSVLTQGKTDGVILMRTWVTDVTIEYLSAQSIPFIVLGNSQDSTVQCVDHDTVRACKEMTSYLIGRGINRIALIGGNIEHTVTQKRLAGFRDSFTLFGKKPIEKLIYLNCNIKETVYNAAEKVINSNAECIVCMDDKICCQVLEKFQAIQVSVPKDIKLVSFYDSYFLEHCKPAVTSLRFDEANLGIIACEELIGRIEQRTYSTRVYTGYKVMLRASTR